MATKTARRVLTPVDITARFRSFSSGRLENWGARSRDGEWAYARLEISGTPWEVTHVSSGADAGWYGSLTAARAATADGTAMAAVERWLDHEGGSHILTRNPFCERC